MKGEIFEVFNFIDFHVDINYFLSLNRLRLGVQQHWPQLRKQVFIDFLV